MFNNSPKVFIIILNWNGVKDTIDCLKSLENLDYPDFEILVVDNGSTDDSVLKIKSQTCPVPPALFAKSVGWCGVPNLKNKVALIENKENLGFPAGNNVGIEYALERGADYALLLNNDTVADKNFLKEMVGVAENNEKIGILGPKIYFYDDPKRIWFAGGSFNWFRGSAHIGFGEIDSQKYESEKEVGFITGCAMLVKKEVFEKIGFLDERFFLYYEDTDFCLKAKKAGFKCFFVPQAKIWHKIPIESLKTKLSGAVEKIGAPSVHYYHHRNVLLLIQNNAPDPIKILKHFWVVWKLIKQGIKIISFPSKREASLAIIKGFLDYYLGQFGKMNNEQ